MFISGLSDIKLSKKNMGLPSDLSPHLGTGIK